MRRLFCTALMLLAALLSSPSFSQDISRPGDLPGGFAPCTAYVPAVARSVETWWPREIAYPSLYLAQLRQESRCDTAAISPAGARGIAQVMPGTWSDLRRKLGIALSLDPHDPIAIEAGALYMRDQMRIWTARRSAYERWLLGLASYNAGAGNILKAQAACGGATPWAEISPCLTQVTGQRNAAETTGYVRRIPDLARELRGLMEVPAELAANDNLAIRCERIPPCLALAS